MASLAVLTGERFNLGMGLSPWVEDFMGTQTDFDSRGPRMDEMMQIIRGFMTGDYFEWKSEYYEIPRSKLCPVPSKCPPFVIGGHSKPAYRRAGQYGNGVNFVSLSEDELVERLEIVNGYRKQYGRENEPFSVYAGMPAFGVDDFKRLEDKGVTDAIVGFRNAYEKDDQTLEQKIAALRGYAENVIAKVS